MPGALEAAETSARCLLARWPDAAAGRRVLREIDDARRHERAAVLARDGAAALEHGAFAEAARLLGLALAADPAIGTVAMVFNETGSGIVNDADGIGRALHAAGKRLILDAVRMRAV